MSLQCLVSALTQEGKGGHLFRLTCSVVLWGGRNATNKYHWHVCGVLVVSGPHWACPNSWHLCFSSLQCSGSRLLCRGTLQRTPGLCALSRSNLLRFRFLGTRQRHRLGWAWVCALPRSKELRWPDAWWVHDPRSVVCLITSLVLAAQFPGCIQSVSQLVSSVT